MSKVAIGLRAQKGGAVIVAVSVTAGVPKLLLSSFLPTAAEGDRLAFEPYLAASELSPAAAAAAVIEGRKRQDEMAARGLRAIAAQVNAGTAALLVNRAGWVTDLLNYSREWPEHIPVAEGLAVREALRFGVRECGLKLVEVDEKSLPHPAEHVAALGKVTLKPWRKEQKLAYLAAYGVHR